MTRPRLPDRILCLVTDGRRGTPSQRGRELFEPVQAAVRGGVNMVQVREKHLSDDGRRTVAEAVRVAARQAGGAGALVVLNAHPAFSIRPDGTPAAAGVQIPEEGFRPFGDDTGERILASVRAAGVLIGRSVHSTAAALKAEADGADFLVLGTVFPSPSHPHGPVGGLELVSDVTAAVRLPVIGIGGITAETAGRVVEAGAAGVAVISAILGDTDPERAARKLWKAVSGAGRPRGPESA